MTTHREKFLEDFKDEIEFAVNTKIDKRTLTDKHKIFPKQRSCWETVKGKTFGTLKPSRRIRVLPDGESIWLCKCECGSEVDVRANHLIDGKRVRCSKDCTAYKPKRKNKPVWKLVDGKWRCDDGKNREDWKQPYSQEGRDDTIPW